MDYPDDVTSTTLPSHSSGSSSTLRLYDIFIPLLGVLIITLNALVVLSSGLLLQKRKLSMHTMIKQQWKLAAQQVCINYGESLTLHFIHHFTLSLYVWLGQEPRSTYFFLGNVGLSDLMTGCAVLFGQFYPRHIRSDLSCSIQMGEFSTQLITFIIIHKSENRFRCAKLEFKFVLMTFKLVFIQPTPISLSLSLLRCRYDCFIDAGFRIFNYPRSDR